MRPLIAVVGRRATHSSILRFSGTVAAEALLDAVLRAGGEPVILHGGLPADMASLPERVARFDGIVLPGGGDLNPGRYCAAPTPDCEIPDDGQDAFDLAVIRAALGSATPTLAICRGLQVLNVALHGTLIQDLDSRDVHRQKPGNADPGKHPSAHRVWVAPDTRLAKIVGAGGLDVNSRHHQAIENLGKGLAVSAISEDGVIEGIEKPAAAFVVAVQWHPEDRVLVSAADRKLFEAFAAAIASSLAGHRAAPRPSS